MITEEVIQRQIGSLMWINGMEVREDIANGRVGLLTMAKDGSEVLAVITKSRAD